MKYKQNKKDERTLSKQKKLTCTYIDTYEIAEWNWNKTEYNKKRYDINTKVLITILRKINMDDLFLYGK